MKKAVVWDLGGVLIDWNPRYLYSKVFTDEKEMEYFLNHVCTLEWNYQGDAGRLFADCIGELSAQFPQYEKQIKLWIEREGEMFSGPIPENVQILNELEAVGHDLYCVTNWSGELFPIAQRRFPFILKFKDVVVSGIEKVTKPNPQIFKILFERNNLAPEQCVFIDDREDNIKAATALGMQGICFQNPRQLRVELQKTGFLTEK